MASNANILFYINLTGEMFYIIAHRMKSQRVKLDLQQRVYKDLAISTFHPIMLHNLIHGELRILEMSMADMRALLDKIAHSSIMTVNSYSMEKLFELALIATRYHFTVCQHPKDILVIALNHLDGVRRKITDPKGLEFCNAFHQTVVDRMMNENAMTMNEYRYAILTVLQDVKLKMTNLIKLGFQKSTGEFVKEFPDKILRQEFKVPGTIEIFWDGVQNGDGSEKFDSTHSSNMEIEDVMKSKVDCHFEDVKLQLHENEVTEDEELLEIEFVGEDAEIEYSDQQEQNVMRIQFSTEEYAQKLPIVISYDLHGDRGITLGESIYEIPGNSDEDEQVEKSCKKTCEEPSHLEMGAVNGLDLCRMLLGCKNNESPYKSQFKSEGIMPENRFGKTSNNGSTSNNTAINVVNFDARRNREKSKIALSKISRELDFDERGNDCGGNRGGEERFLFDIADE